MTRSNDDDPLYCKFCDKKFSSERRVINHLCKIKDRHQQRDDKPVRLGLMAYQRFYQRAMGRKTPPNFADFAKSDVYLAFVRFGKKLVERNAFAPMAFVEFLLNCQAKVDDWTSQRLYDVFLQEWIKIEPPLDAIERTVALMKDWSQTSNHDWRDFFREVEPSLATLWIVTGRISPWLLFTASSAQDLLRRLSNEQIKIVESHIDAEFWQHKLERHKQDVENNRTILLEDGI